LGADILAYNYQPIVRCYSALLQSIEPFRKNLSIPKRSITAILSKPVAGRTLIQESLSYRFPSERAMPAR